MNENPNLELSNNGMINNSNSNIFKEVSVIQSKDRQVVNKKSNGKYFLFYFFTLLFIYFLFLLTI